MKQLYKNATKAIAQLIFIALLLLFNFSSVFSQTSYSASHFTTVWQGENGQNHMNFIVISAILDDFPLNAGDEIAVYSGSSCVGYTKLAQPIDNANSSTFSFLKASQDDGSNNGFIKNDTIVFKLWDGKNQREMPVQKVKYRNNLSTWITNGKYSDGETAVVEITSYTEYTQSIPLIKGTNIFSTFVIPSNPNFNVIMNPLCNLGTLINVLDESGNAFQYVTTSKSWVNNIGSLTPTEGYSISVNLNSTLLLTGKPVTLPLEIPLKKGWNIISYPHMDITNAMTVIQPLINQKNLVKVQDEKGNTIEKIKNGWKNSIGNFAPGKGYKINVSTACTLTIQKSYTKSIVDLAEPEKTEYFMTNYEGNGSDQMNIHFFGLKESGFFTGDELAAFDGDICVGTLKLTEDCLSEGMASLIASCSTDFALKDGFTEGNPIMLFGWNKLTGYRSALQSDVLEGEMKYEKNASVLIQMKSLTTIANNIENSINFDVFPNPAKNTITVQFSKMPEAGSRIEILDISGRKIFSREIHSISEEFKVDNQPAGLFIVKSYIDSKALIKKLIIIK